MKRSFLPIVALICAMLPLDPAMAGRQRWGPNDPTAYAPRSTLDARVSLEQAVRSVQRATGGRVLDAREVPGGYRIKVLTRRGEVRVVHVDAQTGEMR
jgi:hypothetical protein